MIKKIDKRGHEIGSHTHLHNLLTDLNRKEFCKDLTKSIKSIEDVVGKKVTLFRAPAFSIGNNNLWVLEELIKNKIEIDCSFFTGQKRNGGIKKYDINEPIVLNYNGLKIKEFPLNSHKLLNTSIIFSGGGYFRFFSFLYFEKTL